MKAIVLLLAVLVLAGAAMNYLHWMMYGQRFWYFPARGWLRAVFTVCNVVLLIGALLAIVGMMPVWEYFGWALGWVVVLELYCIRRRRKEITGARRPIPAG
jgi:hypothetical protein